MAMLSKYRGVGAFVRTAYTSGSGTHAFNAATIRATITVVGGGGGGGSASTQGGGGGGGGEFVQVMIPVAGGSSRTYAVGAGGSGGTAGGNNGTAGGNTRFAGLSALGGLGGTYSGSSASAGGFGGGKQHTDSRSEERRVGKECR